MDRRTYLKQLALGTSGFYLAPHFFTSCENQPKLDLSGKYKHAPFSQLEEIQNAARLSKGHLAYEMERVLLSKNAKEIYDFVQNRFETIPCQRFQISDASERVRWGTRGLLRYGKGTLREKTDLLFEMLQKTGFKPQLKYASITTNPEIIRNTFCIPKKDNNRIEVPSHYLDSWEKELGNPNATAKSVAIDSTGVESKALAESLIAMLPHNYASKLPKYMYWLDTPYIQAPIVRITANGQTKDLHFVGHSSYEETKEISKNLYKHVETGNEIPKKVYSLSEKTKEIYNDITISLHLTYNTNIYKPTEIIRGTWPLKKLIGRQLATQFIAPKPLENLLKTPIKDINTFMPAFTLRAPEMSLTEKQALSFKGVTFDMFGNLLL